MKITSSAPGKLMLFGEHAVVYGYPCLVTAVDKRMFVTIEEVEKKEDEIITPQVKECHFLKESIDLFKKKYNYGKSLKITTRGDFSHQVGLGSSSAITVATFSALSNICKVSLSKKDLFDLSYQITLKIQGVGSGFDIAAAVYGGTLSFLTGGKKIEPLNLKKLPLIIGYSGVKADTPKIVKSLKLKIQAENSKYFRIFDQMKNIVNKAEKELVLENWKEVGFLMNENHRLLQFLGVSTEKLDRMCYSAVSAGAYGSKLSGAGGGDCMIALTSFKKIKPVEKALLEVKGEVIRADVNAQGVRIEKL